MNKRNARRSAHRRSKSWSSHVIGSSYNSTTKRTSRASSRSSRRPTSYRSRSGEIRQMRPQTRSVEGQGVQIRSGQREVENFAKKQRIKTLALGIIALVLAVVIALNVGSCAFKASVSSAMNINDADVSSALVSTEESQPYYVLIAGIADEGSSEETSSYLSVLRVDEQNNVLSFLSVPNNIGVSLSQEGDYMLRDVSRIDGEGALISNVSEQLGIDFAHYIRISDEGFVNLIDSLGGLTVNVEQRVDDPRVSSTVINVGEQTLMGDQALVYVSAFNYQDGRETRSNIQQQVLITLINELTHKRGIDFMGAADTLAHAVKTDMNFEQLERIAAVYSHPATIYTAQLPGSSYVSGDQTYFSISTSTWNQVSERFKNGEDPTINIDTSGVDKANISLVVSNGSGIEGLAAQAAEKLTAAGYTVSETGNMPTYVYNETLVVYREEKDLPSAEAITADLGIGRTVAAGVNYALTTDVQVIIGKDWDQFV